MQITGAFTEGEARSLARVLNRGAFPVNVEAQTVQTVSPTLGSDSLRGGRDLRDRRRRVLVLFHDRLLPQARPSIIIAGLIVWGMAVYGVSALVSQWTNYAFTLAGCTGIIVSIGVTVDSYVVFFERLKDEVRAGRSLRNSPRRAFKVTWRTIVSADVVAFLGSAILFWSERRLGDGLRALPRAHDDLRHARSATSSPVRRCFLARADRLVRRRDRRSVSERRRA